MDQTKKGPSLIIENLSLLELYLLSVSVGLPLAKETRGYLQAYLEAIELEALKLGMINSERIFAIALGADLELSESIRNKAIDLIAGSTEGNLAKYHDIKLLIEHNHESKINKLVKTYDEVMLTIPVPKKELFEELTREWFCLHAAMLLEGAAGLRRYHLQEAELNEEKIRDHFMGGLKQFQVKLKQSE